MTTFYYNKFGQESRTASPAFFCVTFLASEYRTTDGGRMDSIGIDENHCPVIFEYKRSTNENVMILKGNLPMYFVIRASMKERNILFYFP